MNLDIPKLASMLCRDVVFRVARRGEREFISTNFTYPNGDLIAIHLEEIGGRTFVSDKGSTLFNFCVTRSPLNEAQLERVEMICRRHAVVLDRGILRKPLGDSAGIDCLRFCEAISQVSAIELDRDVRDTSLLVEQVGMLLKEKVSPQREVQRKWSHPVYDTGRDYPVDFHINGVGLPRNIFCIGSTNKSNLVGLVSTFLKLNDADIPTLSIVDPNLKLPEHPLSRLQRASTEIRFGIKGYEDDIVNFALQM